MGLEEDKLSNALIPEDLPPPANKIYEAVKATGYGDCLYNAVSLVLVGNESYAILLRLLVALELAINVSLYLRTASQIYLFSFWWSPSQYSIFPLPNEMWQQCFP